MNKKQLNVIKLCDLNFDKNIISFKHKSYVEVIYDPIFETLRISLKNHKFNPMDYESVEQYSIDLNRMLGLVYELDLLKGEKNEN